MREDNAPAETGPGRSGKANSWRRHLPYLLVLALALAGVAYANMSQKSLAGYWELLALISGGVCIFTEWGKIEEKQARVRLVWTQAVHWITVLVEHHVAVRCTAIAARAGHQSGLSDVAGARLFSGRAQSYFARIVLSRAGFGSRRSGSLVSQTIHSLRHSRRSLCGRHWHHLLVKPERKVIDPNKPLRSRSSGRTAGQRRQLLQGLATSCPSVPWKVAAASQSDLSHLSGTSSAGMP